MEIPRWKENLTTTQADTSCEPFHVTACHPTEVAAYQIIGISLNPSFWHIEMSSQRLVFNSRTTVSVYSAIADKNFPVNNG